MPLPSKHQEIQDGILQACNNLGFSAFQEYRGNGWRADVFATNGVDKFAFEVQISPQSLKATLERQRKYIQDGINCCWLFEKKTRSLSEEERPDLPLFIVQPKDQSFTVSLNGRREIALQEFVEVFLQKRIKFCNVARTKVKQLVKLIFFEMKCWKCGEINHVYHVIDEESFRSSCNAVIYTEEMMSLWDSKSAEYMPEIIRLAQGFAKIKKLRLGQIKRRYSRTVGASYMSFGCYKCDSIFGDFYVKDAALNAVYDPSTIRLEGEIELRKSIELPLPHWCYPGELPFCDQRGVTK